MSNLVELFDNVVEFQNYNGVPLAAGKLYVFALGRTRLMDTWSDVDGESLNPNPIILDDLGQCHCYVSDSFDYTIVVCDQFDNEVFSVDKYLLSKGEHSHADVAVAPSEHIGVSSYYVGEVTVYVPYLTGEVGKVYEGIDPIVVNNTLNRISANHIPLGVQDPLYFVEDSESACILGCSTQTEIPSALSSKWDEASDTVIANSAQWAEGTEYEAGSYVSIDDNTISVTGLQPEGDYAYNSALSSKLDVTALPQDLVHSGDLTAYQPAGNYQTAGDYQTAGNYLSATDSANFYPIDNPSGFITSVDLTDYATTAQLDEKLDKSDSGNFYPMEGNPSGFLTAHQSLQGYATEQWVEDKGYITGVDIPESANWNSTYNTVHDNSASWTGGSTPNPQIPVTGINGIKISESGDQVVFEVSGDYYPGNNPSGFITGVDLSDYATTAQVSEKLDTTAFSTVSGDFLTAVDLAPYQLTADMTAYQPAGSYLTTADSANFYTTANESGFISEVPAGTMNESAFEYDENDKISGYNGSAFAGGSDVPEGVMVESGLEYNAVNEISGYNGSAIAQYGAEKQWLVHDDTLVHATDSAQYALGVNLSAVAQLLGVDETVLYTTSSQETNYNLSGSLLNYNKFKVLFRYNDGYRVWEEFDGTTDIGNIPSPHLTTITGKNTYIKMARFSADAAGTQIIRNNTIDIENFTNKIFGSDIVWIQEVVGIGRKQ